MIDNVRIPKWLLSKRINDHIDKWRVYRWSFGSFEWSLGNWYLSFGGFHAEVRSWDVDDQS